MIERDEVLIEFKKFVEKGNADYCVIKKDIKGIEVSFHIILSETLKKICNINYTDIKNSIKLKEFRVLKEKKLKPKTYTNKNFAGEKFTYTTKPYLVENGQISEIPLIEIGPHKELIFGIVLNRYLPLPKLDRDASWVKEEFDRLILQLQLRKKIDKIKFPGKTISFLNIHSQVDHMPKWIKDELKKLD